MRHRLTLRRPVARGTPSQFESQNSATLPRRSCAGVLHLTDPRPTASVREDGSDGPLLGFADTAMQKR